MLARRPTAADVDGSARQKRTSRIPKVDRNAGRRLLASPRHLTGVHGPHRCNHLDPVPAFPGVIVPAKIRVDSGEIPMVRLGRAAHARTVPK